MHLNMHFPGLEGREGGGGGSGVMYHSKCDHDRKVIQKKTQTNPLIMCCKRLVNSVTDYY